MSPHHRLRGLIAVAVAGLALGASTAGARVRWPVVGCDAPSGQPGPVNHYAWKYKPTGVCVIASTTAGIDHAHWGSKRATATGDHVDSLGFMYPARLTAFDLTVTHNFLGNGTDAAWYNRLRVVAKREFRGGIERGPFNVVLDVTPDE